VLVAERTHRRARISPCDDRESERSDRAAVIPFPSALYHLLLPFLLAGHDHDHDHHSARARPLFPLSTTRVAS
jgi:hypothetical protein